MKGHAGNSKAQVRKNGLNKKVLSRPQRLIKTKKVSTKPLHPHMSPSTPKFISIGTQLQPIFSTQATLSTLLRPLSISPQQFHSQQQLLSQLFTPKFAQTTPVQLPKQHFASNATTYPKPVSPPPKPKPSIPDEPEEFNEKTGELQMKVHVPQQHKDYPPMNVRKMLTEFDQTEISIVSWDPEDEKNAKLALDAIENHSEAAIVFQLMSAGEHSLSFMQAQFPHLDFTFDPKFKSDPESHFHPFIQQLPLYKAFPKSIARFRAPDTLPPDFDSTQFVLDNINRFPEYPDHPVLQSRILAQYREVCLMKEMTNFITAFEYDVFARTYSLHYIGADDYNKSIVALRVARHKHDQEQMADIDLRVDLQMTDEQIDALDSVLSFTLPHISQQQTDQMMIHHLKKKAELLTTEYNNDPFMRAHIDKRYDLQGQIQEMEEQRALAVTERFKMKAFITSKEKEFASRDTSTLDKVALAAFEAEKNLFLADKEESLAELDHILGKIQEETTQLQRQKRQMDEQPVLSADAMKIISKLPITDQYSQQPGITISNLDKAKIALGDQPLMYGRDELNPKTGKPKPKLPVPTNPDDISTPKSQIQEAHIIANQKKISFGKKLSLHYELTKPRISQMVAVTSLWGYLSVGNPTNWSDLGLLTAGTIALSSSASIINQIRETDVDAKMTRTMSRPLVTGAISVDSAKKQAAMYAALGTAILSPLYAVVPFLGLSNVLLYGGIYTSLKRITPLNTEVGAVVGAIPPLMGYFAALTATQSWDQSLTALCFPAAMMISWQIQHVMLICNRRGDDYNRSGLVMQCKDDPGYKTTINKGIAWAVISTVISAIPFFTGYADLKQLFATYLWAVYTIPYAMAMKKRDNRRLGNVLLAGYVVLGLTIVLSIMARVPADNLGYLITEGPNVPSPLPEVAPSLFDVLFKGAGRPLTATEPIDVIASDIVAVAGTTDAQVTAQILNNQNEVQQSKDQLAKMTHQILSNDPATMTSQDKDV